VQTNCLEELTRPAPNHQGMAGRSDWVHIYHSVLPVLSLHQVRKQLSLSCALWLTARKLGLQLDCGEAAGSYLVVQLKWCLQGGAASLTQSFFVSACFGRRWTRDVWQVLCAVHAQPWLLRTTPCSGLQAWQSGRRASGCLVELGVC
jgi:hypothetical protein